MTQMEREKLIELGVLTPDCGPSAGFPNLPAQLKREARRRMNAREQMTGGVVLAMFLERLRTMH